MTIPTKGTAVISGKEYLIQESTFITAGDNPDILYRAADGTYFSICIEPGWESSQAVTDESAKCWAKEYGVTLHTDGTIERWHF